MGSTVYFKSTSEQATIASPSYTAAGVATDPTTVSLAVTTPSGTTTTYTYAGSTITKTSTGVFTKLVTCSEDGDWTYVWTATGTVVDSSAGTFTVFNTDLNKDYCTVEELKSRLGYSATDTTDDFEIRLAVESSSRWIDSYCDRRFWRGTDTRTYSARRYMDNRSYFMAMNSYTLEIDDLVSITTLKTDASGDGVYETTWATTDYQLLPVNPQAAPETRPYTAIRAVGSYTFPINSYPGVRDDLVQIVGVFGWPEVPLPVKLACLILSAEALKMKDAPFGVAGFADFGAVRVRDNPRIATLLAPYRKFAVMVA